MDTSKPQTAAQIAAKKRLHAAHIALNNLLANKENNPAGYGATLAAAQSELTAAQTQYRTAFAAELAANPNLGAGI